MRIDGRRNVCFETGILAIFLAASAVTAAPRIEVDQEEWSFREVISGTAVQHVFEVSNTGDAPLQLGQIRALCAPCTGSIVSVNPIAPGATGKLLLTYRAEEKLGDVTAGVVVHTNDPEQPFKKLVLKGKVLPRGDAPRITSIPQRVETGVLIAGAPAEYSVRVSNEGKKPLFIEDVTGSDRCTSDWIPKQEKKHLLPGQNMELTVFVDTKRIRGALTEYVVIQSTDSAQPLLTVPVTGYVVDSSSDIGAVPDALLMRMKDGRLEVTGDLAVGAKMLVSPTPPKPTTQWLAEEPKPDAGEKLSALVEPGKEGWTYILIAIPAPKEAATSRPSDGLGAPKP